MRQEEAEAMSQQRESGDDGRVRNIVSLPLAGQVKVHRTYSDPPSELTLQKEIRDKRNRKLKEVSGQAESTTWNGFASGRISHVRYGLRTGSIVNER